MRNSLRKSNALLLCRDEYLRTCCSGSLEQNKANLRGVTTGSVVCDFIKIKQYMI